MNNHIKKMLRITNADLYLTNTEEIKIKGNNSLVIKGSYSPMPSACKNCCHNWTAQCTIVEKNCHISKFVTLKILELLTEKISMTFIAKLCQVSLTTVLRVLKSVENQLPHQLKPSSFPEVLMVDEFRSHASFEDKMSFICANGKTGELVDILPSRKLNKLTTYLSRSPLEEREKVKFLVTDMNAAYSQLTKNVFPNASLIIDRFQIVKHLNTTFNGINDD